MRTATPLINIDHFLPYILVMVEAKNEAMSAAKYRDDEGKEKLAIKLVVLIGAYFLCCLFID